MEIEVHRIGVRILKNVIYSLGVEKARAPNEVPCWMGPGSCDPGPVLLVLAERDDVAGRGSIQPRHVAQTTS